MQNHHLLLRFLSAALVAFTGLSLRAAVPDNGFGTANMPILLPYYGLSPMNIVDGLPVGTTINIDAVLTSPVATIEAAGGTLGGNKSGAETSFTWNMQGTGLLAGYNRAIVLPLNGGVLSFPGLPTAGIEVHSAPRTLAAPVQSFDTDMFRMFGQITSDPDFDLLRLVAGTDFGLPSPGHTTLTQNGGNWDVDSFFDITYRIDFVGHPGGPLSGRSGSTTGTVRLVTTVPEPSTFALLTGAAVVLLLARNRDQSNARK
jgi:hypothetical protein